MKRTLSIVVVTLVIAWCLLVLLSWLLSAMMVEGVRSMLSSEGIRWFLGHAVYGLCHPLLVWLLMVAMTWGCVTKSRLLTGGDLRRKAGLRVALLLLVVCVAVVVMLTALPQAVLLSATGTLWNSPFSNALMPMLCFTVMLCCTGYGLVVRPFTSVGDIIGSLVEGVAKAAPLILVYMIAMLFYGSFCYIFSFNV